MKLHNYTYLVKLNFSRYFYIMFIFIYNTYFHLTRAQWLYARVYVQLYSRRAPICNQPNIKAEWFLASSYSEKYASQYTDILIPCTVVRRLSPTSLKDTSSARVGFAARTEARHRRSRLSPCFCRFPRATFFRAFPLSFFFFFFFQGGKRTPARITDICVSTFVRLPN